MTDQNEAAAREAGYDAWYRTSVSRPGRPAFEAGLTAYKQALPAAPGVEDVRGLLSEIRTWLIEADVREERDDDSGIRFLNGQGWEEASDLLDKVEAMLSAAPSAPLASTVAAPGVEMDRDDLKKKIAAIIEEEFSAHIPAGDEVATFSLGAAPERILAMLAPTPVAASGPTLGSEDVDNVIHSLDTAEKQRQIDAARLASAAPSLVAAGESENKDA